MASVLLHQQHACAGGVDGPDFLEDVLHDDRRKAKRRFVQTEQLRFGHHRAAERQHLLLSPAQRTGILATPLRQTRKHGENAIEALTNFCGVTADIESTEFEVFPHGQKWENTPPLGNERDTELAP